MCIDVDPLRYAGAAWAVPLWSERGLIGFQNEVIKYVYYRFKY